MSSDKARTKAGKRQAPAKFGRRRTSLKDLAARKRKAQAVTGGRALGPDQVTK